MEEASADLTNNYTLFLYLASIVASFAVLLYWFSHESCRNMMSVSHFQLFMRGRLIISCCSCTLRVTCSVRSFARRSTLKASPLRMMPPNNTTSATCSISSCSKDHDPSLWPLTMHIQLCG